MPSPEARPNRPPRAPRSDADLSLLDDGSIKNRRAERFALMVVDGVLSNYKCFVITHSSANGNLPRSKRMMNILSSAVFKARVEELVSEKEALEAQGIWGQLEYQARQNYRRACAFEDLPRQLAATEQLMKIALRGGKPPKAEPEEVEEEGAIKRGPGAPTVPISMDNTADRMRDRLASRA